jgi:hypothetical protein
MKTISFLLTLAWSTLSHGAIDKALDCTEYFSTNPTDGQYQRLENGLAQDSATGLTWYRCNAGQTWVDGQCQGDALLLSYEAAQEWAASTTLAGFDDWRVPEIDDMDGLVESDCKSPSINTRIFIGIEPEVYWSSESNFWIRSMAWSLFFYRGHYFNKQSKDDSFKFMLVRD